MVNQKSRKAVALKQAVKFPAVEEQGGTEGMAKRAAKPQAVHSPLPWVLINDAWINSSNGCLVVGTESHYLDLRAITAAVNSHAALVAALRKAEEALKDILGAAENGQPYSPKELNKEFIEAYNDVYAAIEKAGWR